MTDVSPMIHQTLLGDAWEHAAVAAAIFADDGRYIACNQAFCRLTGYRRSEITDLRVGVDLAVETRKNTKLFREVTTEQRTSGTAGLKRKDGTALTVNFWAIETKVANLPYFIVLCWDASRRPKRRLLG